MTAPEDHIRHIGQIAVPCQVGPYFSTSATDPVALGEYAASVGREPAAEEHRALVRLGTDRGYELCVSPEAPWRPYSSTTTSRRGM
ncbi:hypothetical protein [Streptomyces sp. MST-110588]|uniref:hypothetical protein n=1 Tax=Streptomyces sp. MST-110588 TaxID=2833628 RepID=UPI001F5D31C2|nr:hypothetical protein [Streptomyces sp. MST-110588]UNO38640.1 hypothetical protein KGS77_01995 [Streptomyces sp. MST-110588]